MDTRKCALELIEEQQRELNRKRKIIETIPFNVPVILNLEYIITDFNNSINAYIAIITHFTTNKNTFMLEGRKLAVMYEDFKWEDQKPNDLCTSINCLKEWRIMDRFDFAPTINWHHLSYEYKKLFDHT